VARGILRELVGGQILLHAAADGADRYLTEELSGDYSGLVGLVLGPKIKMVAEAVVRWVRQTEYVIETIAIQKHTHQRLQQFISDRLCCAGRPDSIPGGQEGKSHQATWEDLRV
jgi:hypothetical protein